MVGYFAKKRNRVIMGKLIGITIVKNETHNYLDAWLKNMENFLDYHIFLDDASTDNTPEYIQSIIDSGYKGEVHQRETSLFKDNEPKLRAELWEYARKVAKDGDWILIVDADEFYDERLLELKPKLFKLNPKKYECVKVSIVDMWDKEHYRTDGLWSPKNSDVRIIRYKDCEFGATSTELHQPPYPASLNTKKKYKTYIPKIHMAYLKKADRIRRYEFYKQNVDNTKLNAHALSVLETKPILNKYLSALYNIKRHFKPVVIDVFKDIELKKVLILEPHPYHEIILPGFSKYFEDLGYQTDIFIQEAVKNSNCFDRFKYPPSITTFKPNNIRKRLKNKDIEQYDFIFFSSLEYLHKKFRGKFVDYLGFEPKTKHGLLGCYHTISFIEEFNDEKNFEEGRFFTISGFSHKEFKTEMLTPIHLGQVHIKTQLNEKIRFITVGNVTNYSKNHNLLFNAIDKLIENNYTNFEVIVIGKGDFEVPEKYEHYIKYLGALNYPDMYKEMEQADFFLPLLDPNNENQRRYLTCCTTGSKLLILGFLTPCLINEEFAKVYDFNDSNSIVYDENNLFEAMKQATEVKQEQYTIMQENLKELTNDIYQKSLKNLKTEVEKLEESHKKNNSSETTRKY